MQTALNGGRGVKGMGNWWRRLKMENLTRGRRRSNWRGQLIYNGDKLLIFRHSHCPPLFPFSSPASSYSHPADLSDPEWLQRWRRGKALHRANEKILCSWTFNHSELLSIYTSTNQFHTLRFLPFYLIFPVNMPDPHPLLLASPFWFNFLFFLFSFFNSGPNSIQLSCNAVGILQTQFLYLEDASMTAPSHCGMQDITCLHSCFTAGKLDRIRPYISAVNVFLSMVPLCDLYDLPVVTSSFRETPLDSAALLLGQLSLITDHCLKQICRTWMSFSAIFNLSAPNSDLHTGWKLLL